MDESILDSIKKLLGIDSSYDIYDHDIILHINSVFSVLHQIGASPPERAYRITGSTETWSLFVSDLENVDLVKTYIYLRVRLLFDPPSTSFAIEAVKSQITEFEWRLQKLENVFNPFALPDTSDDIWPSKFATANQGALAETASQPGHSHVVADITDFLDEVSGIVATLLGSYAPLVHGHAITDVTDLQTELDNLNGNKVNNNDSRLSDARTPLPHPHDVNDVAGAATALSVAALDSRIDDLEAASGPDLSGYATDAELAAEASARAAADAALDSRVDVLEAAPPGYTDEMTQDVVGAMVAAAGGTYDDTAGTITLPASSGGGSGMFRGVWSNLTVDSTLNLESGIPPEITTSGVVTTVDVPSKTGTPPTGTKVLRSDPTSNAPVDISFVVPADIIAVRCRAALNDAGGTILSIRVNGAVIQSSTNGSAWVEFNASVVAGNTVVLRTLDTFTWGSYGFFGQIEFLKTVEPYMAGEYVLHNNRLWRSDVDNNVGTPGTSGWTEAQWAIDIADVTGLQSALDTKVASTSVDDIVVLTQAAYDALTPKVSTTLYVIVG